MIKNELEICPCCELRTILETGAYEICTICGWEDDPTQSKDPNFSGGANSPSLNEAKLKWKKCKG
jgi:anaerobic ribonucleoside-triphosphate reductase